MAECPFCGGEVDEDLITFGGPCPKCFAHIPGEEAATDPGEEIKAAQEASDRRRSTFKAMIPVALMAPVVLCAGLGAVWYGFLRPEPEVAVLDFDELDDYYVPEIIAAAPPAPEEAPKAATKTASKPAPKGPRTPDASRYAPKDIGEGGADASALRGSDAVADAGSDRPRRPAEVGPTGPASLSGELSASGSQQSGLNFGLDVTNARKAGVLEDPEAIREMIAKQMSAQIQQLQQCYERELKSDNSLQGKWRIKYTVTKAGTVANASAEGLNVGNSALEECMATQMIRWRFGRIGHDQPVQRTITLRPS